MNEFAQPLPIDAALPELTGALRAQNVAVLVAPARRRQDHAGAARAGGRGLGG